MTNPAHTLTVYVNPKQEQFLEAKQKVKFALCGRAFGKSYLIGEHNLDKMRALPGAKNALVGLTFIQLKNKTVLPMTESWRDNWGMEEYDEDTKAGDYVLYKKPPRAWIKKMRKPPGKWENIISFPNGYHIELVSAVSLDYVRGASYDCMDIDELGFCLDEEEYDNVLSPTIRGNVRIYDHPLHHSIGLFTSIPWSANGQWIYKFEELAKTQPEKYFWIEGNAYDNVVVLGEQWIEDQRDILGDLRFRVEILNERMAQMPNCFYPKFSFDGNVVSIKALKQYYRNKGVPDLDSVFDLMVEGKYEALWDSLSVYDATDYCLDPNAPIDVSFDFNASLNTMLVAQLRGLGYMYFNELFVKYESYLENVRKFCNMYDKHRCKKVCIYGDRNGNKRDASMLPTFFEKIIAEFKALGWSCELVSTGGVEQAHHLRYDAVNSLLEGVPGLPAILLFENTCRLTIFSIRNTPVKVGKNGFEKDKSSEARLLKTGEREKATDWGDNMDYLLVDKFGRKLGVVKDSMPIEFPK